MHRRWKILITVGLVIALADQWTKLLVIEHLTPGFVLAHAEKVGPSSFDEQRRAVAELGFGPKLDYFYGGVEHPCVDHGRHCPTISVVDGFWNWRYVENPGAAWGLMARVSDGVRVPFFIAMSIAALVFIILFFRKMNDGQLLLAVALSLVFGGAIGNFIDRLHLNYVIDFIDWYAGTYHWPTFNVADSAITTGMCLLGIEWIRDFQRAKSRAGQAAAEPQG